MSRRTTTIWVIGAVVVVGVGIGVAANAVATAPARPLAATSESTSARPTPSSVPGSGSESGSGSGQGSGSQSGSGSQTSPPAGSGTSPSGPSPTTPAVAVKQVVPTMSYYAFASGTLTLGGGVSGLVDTGGTCTVTVTNGQATVTQRFAASPGPSSTDCGAMSISSPKLTSGTWTVTIAYSSPRATGTSIKNEVAL